MKKIIALLILVCCAFSMFSCGTSYNNVDDATAEQLESIVKMFLTSVPTKSVTETTHTVGNVTLTGKATLTTGLVGGKAASVYTNTYEKLAEVSNNLQPVTTVTETMWYLEGKGVCRDKSGEWDAEGKDFGPTAGSIKLNLDPKLIETATYKAETSTVEITVSKDNATKVVADYLKKGQEIASDLKIVIVTYGGSISEITLSYTIPEHEEAVEGSEDKVTVQETSVVIKATYTYDIQNITLE